MRRYTLTVSMCGAHAKDSEVESVMEHDDTCTAVCASTACHLSSFLAAGPTPTTAGHGLTLVQFLDQPEPS